MGIAASTSNADIAAMVLPGHNCTFFLLNMSLLMVATWLLYPNLQKESNVVPLTSLL